MDNFLPSSQEEAVPPQTPSRQVTNTRPTNMSSNPRTPESTSANRKVTITLSVHKQNASEPTIQVKTFFDNAPCTTNNYPINRTYQSTAWPGDLRLVQRASIALALGPHSTPADRIAMNQTLAGLLNFIDAASEIKFLQIQPLNDNNNLTTEELLEVVQPLTMWARRMPDVAVKLVNVSALLTDLLLQMRRSHSRSDDAVERFYSAVRIAARAGAWLHQAGLDSRLLGLNRKFEIIMAELGFVGPGPDSSARLEAGTRRAQGVLELILDGVGDRTEESGVKQREAVG